MTYLDQSGQTLNHFDVGRRLDLRAIFSSDRRYDPLESLDKIATQGLERTLHRSLQKGSPYLHRRAFLGPGLPGHHRSRNSNCLRRIASALWKLK